jgi:phosphoglucomutase
MAAYYKTRGMTLIDALNELFAKYGAFRESVFSIGMTGVDAQAKMASMMDNLRTNPPAYIGTKKVAVVKDYLTETVLDLRTGEKSGTNLPVSNVLYYLTEDQNLTVVRPSGTEPKVKIYVLANGSDMETAQINAEDCTAGIKKLLNA